MSDGGQVPGDTPADHDRSGTKVDEAVDRAAESSADGGTLRSPEASAPHTAPVEQAGGDADMSGGRTTGDADAAGDPVDPPATPPQEAAVSGGAQSDPGARASDRVAAGDDD